MKRKQDGGTMAFCKVSFDLFLDKGTNPSYRLYINDELFAERTYSFPENKYLRENIQIDAEPGEYNINLVKLNKCKFRLRNTTADFGPVEVIDSTTFRILE